MSSLKAKFASAGITALALCGVTTVVATPANAGGHSVYKVSNNIGAYGEFRSYGEVMCASDVRADGHGVVTVLDVKFDDGWNNYPVYEGRGVNHTTCIPWYSGLHEGTTVRVKTCLSDGAPSMEDPHPEYACSGWKYGTA